MSGIVKMIGMLGITSLLVISCNNNYKSDTEKYLDSINMYTDSMNIILDEINSKLNKELEKRDSIRKITKEIVIESLTVE